jgi:hypothetical protein
MTKLLLFISIGIIIYLLLQPTNNAPLDKTEPVADSQPIVMDPPKDAIPINDDVSEEIKNLPVEEVKSEAPLKKRSPLSGLKLIGTIYGTENPSAMLADANNKTFVVRLQQKVLKSDFTVTNIGKDRIYLRKNDKTYVLVMNKAR